LGGHAADRRTSPSDGWGERLARISDGGDVSDARDAIDTVVREDDSGTAGAIYQLVA